MTERDDKIKRQIALGREIMKRDAKIFEELRMSEERDELNQIKEEWPAETLKLRDATQDLIAGKILELRKRVAMFERVVAQLFVENVDLRKENKALRTRAVELESLPQCAVCGKPAPNLLENEARCHAHMRRGVL